MRKALAIGVLTAASLLAALPVAAQQSGGGSGAAGGNGGGGYDNSSVYAAAAPRTHASNRTDEQRYRIHRNELASCGGFLEVTQNSNGQKVFFCHPSYAR